MALGIFTEARKYIYLTGATIIAPIMSTLFVTQYCHVHFNGEGVVVLENTCSTPRNPLCTTKEFFLKKTDLSTNNTHLHDGFTLLLRPEYFSYFPFMCSLFFKFGNPREIKSPYLYKKAKP